MYGKTALGVVRATYIIDENGIIEKSLKKQNQTQMHKRFLNIWKTGVIRIYDYNVITS